MERQEEITQLLFDTIDELNADWPDDSKLDRSTDTVLFGRSGKLNSLELVNLVVAVEEKIDERFGIPLSLADERAMSEEQSPLSTVGSLVDYISLLLGEHLGG